MQEGAQEFEAFKLKSSHQRHRRMEIVKADILASYNTGVAFFLNKNI